MSSNVIQNQYLTVKFEEDRYGLRPASIEYAATGETYRFARYDEVGLVVLPPQAVSDPGAATAYRFREDLKYEGAVSAKASDGLALTFRDALVRVEVSYLLEADAPVLRKTVRCYAEDEPAYVAGGSCTGPSSSTACAPLGLRRTTPTCSPGCSSKSAAGASPRWSGRSLR